MQNTEPKKHILKDTFKRSIVKSVSYRIIIITLDFTTVYLFTGKVNLAVGFMLVSNIYTTIAYFFHERIWDRIKWGKELSVH
jgi:adenylylsulfate kinase